MRILLNLSRFHRCRVKSQAFLAWALAILAICGGSCSERQGKPEKVMEVNQPVRMLVTSHGNLVAVAQNVVYEPIDHPQIKGMDPASASAKKDELYVWDWKNISFPPQVVEIEMWPAVLTVSDQLFVARVTPEPFAGTVISRTLEDDVVIQSWSRGEGYSCRHMYVSYNGKYVAVGFQEDITYSLKRDRNSKRKVEEIPYGFYCLGVIDAETEEMQWVTKWDSIAVGPKVGNVAVSEDGRFVAAAGVNNGGWLLVADVSQQKKLWEIQPEWAVNFNDVCFSPDSKIVYIGGNGGVYLFDSMNGHVKATWKMPTRCISIVASPDGRLVAGGTGPAGEVYIFEAGTGRILRTLRTGQYTNYGLAFSPDSTLLATSGIMYDNVPTHVKIWKMPSPPSPKN